MIKKTLLNLSLIIGLMSSGTCWLLANPVKIHRKSLALEIENKRKKAEEKKRQEQAIEYRKLEDEKRKTKNYNRLLAYQQQITKMKDLYLYMWDDTCYVSGINKNINEMTEAEIDRLAANKGCGHIAKEIRYAKKMLSDGNRKLQTGNLESKGIYHEQKCDYAPIPPKPVNDVVQNAPYGKLRNGESCNIIYIIDENGELAMAIAVSAGSPVLDQFYISKIRALKKWVPGMRQGKHVSVMYNATSMVHKTQYYYPTYNFNRYHPRSRW
ncbi:hypothetical protein [Xylanibacter rodentium]|jgi:hypothetical protein|uniref:TonB C-terminal domain-containing protein n=1 Tax=Xylanibacter rodentium TaxID=2736289 RepID=A0ABX2AUW4_9BACT|nr:hypothetical protein [Xylanibacter rodentium]NPE12231.1 hypothetical protein [Prevotella sp. PJ1A]NPE14519.1 hypothetical protein [Xylanibacter rodentium]NPE39637.1 hypothetical protein [Prevotella sp. PCJ2]